MSTSRNTILATSNTNKKKSKYKIVQKIQETYTELTNSNRYIVLTWDSSHQGISGNAKAYFYAKQAENSSLNEMVHFPTKTPSSQSVIWKKKNGIRYRTGQTDRWYTISRKISTNKYVPGA